MNNDFPICVAVVGTYVPTTATIYLFAEPKMTNGVLN